MTVMRARLPLDIYRSIDADGNQTSHTDPLDHTTTTIFNADDEATLVTDPAGDATLTCYDGAGDTTETVPPLGVAAGSLTPASCPTSYSLDPLTGYGDRLAADATTDTYDTQGDKTAETTPAPAGESGDETTTYLYDGAGNLVETVAPPTSSANGAPDDVTYDTYDPGGQLLAETTGYSTSTAATTTYCYDPAGDQTAVVSPDGDAAGLASCETSSPWQINATTYPTQAGYATLSSYDSTGELVAKTLPPASGDGTGETTTYCYDPDGNQTASVAPDGNTEGTASCESSSPWQINTTTYPTQASYETTTSYSPGGSLISQTDPLGNTTTNTYDADGNELTTTDPSSNVTTNTYDPFGETATVTTASGTTTNYYDADGDMVATTAPDGNPANCDPVTTTGCAYTTYSSYDQAGRLVATTNPDGAVTTNYYDADGDVVATTGPSGDAYSASNPSGCNPVTTQNCADTEYKSYDMAGNVSGATYTDGTPPVDYGYEPGGERCYMYAGSTSAPCSSPPSGAATYSYDPAGRMTSETNSAGATLTYAYDSGSNLTCESYPNTAGNTCSSSGTPTGVARFTYNQTGQLATIADWAGNTLSYSYDASGQATDISANNGAVTVATSYDHAGNVSSIAASNGSGDLLTLSVGSRNADEYVTSENPTVGASANPTDSYSYNVSNQLSSGPVASSGSTSYTYTNEGGITAAGGSFAGAAYNQAGELCWTSSSTSSNSCSSPPSGATTYAYDSDGERTSTMPAWGNRSAYGWDTLSGELVCVNTNGASCSTSQPTSTTTVYSYDGDGLRSSATISAITTDYTWDTLAVGTPQLASDGTWDFVYSPGRALPLEQIAETGSAPTSDLLVSDQSGNMRGVIQLSSGSKQKELVNYTDYDAYGNPITSSGGAAEPGGLSVPHVGFNSNYVGNTPWGYGEGYTDSTGLVYLIHRYYDPATSQFTSVDPLLVQTMQPYQYANDNPTTATDPSGMNASGCTGGWWELWAWCITVIGSGTVIDGIGIAGYATQNGYSLGQVLFIGNHGGIGVHLRTKPVADTPNNPTGKQPVEMLSAQWGCMNNSDNCPYSYELGDGKKTPVEKGFQVCGQFVGTSLPSGTASQNEWSPMPCETIGSGGPKYAPLPNLGRVPSPLQLHSNVQTSSGYRK